MQSQTITFTPRPLDWEHNNLRPSMTTRGCRTSTARSLVKRATTVLMVWTSLDRRVTTRDATFENVTEYSVHGSSSHYDKTSLLIFLFLFCYEGDVLNSPTWTKSEHVCRWRREFVLLSKDEFWFWSYKRFFFIAMQK